MKSLISIILVVSYLSNADAQLDSVVISEPSTLDLEVLIVEAVLHNPQIEASLHQMDVMEAKIPQASALEDPELTYSRMEMPGFRWSEAMYSTIGLMQRVRFPWKLSMEGRMAGIRAEHAHHDHLEKLIEVLQQLKSAYYELWFVQQSIVLNRENIRLMNLFVRTARTKYGVGLVQQQVVLKAQVEVAMMENELVSLRQQELSAKSMLSAILNRSDADSLGYAVVPEEVSFESTLDSLEQLALRTRPMLVHDSLAIEEGNVQLSLAKQEFLPDLQFGIEYVTSPVGGVNGWSVNAGITLPFAPWVLGKANARMAEARATIMQATSALAASRNMILASVRDLYHKAMGGKQQLDTYRLLVIPQVEQSLQASLTAYETGQSDFLMLIDAYRTRVDALKEYFMLRMKFEQNVAQLERAIGVQSISTLLSN